VKARIESSIRIRVKAELPIVFLVAALAAPAAAQIRRPEETRPELPDFEPPARPESRILPPLPLPEEPDTEGLAAGATVFLREVRIRGSTVLSAEELAELARPFVGREVSFADLARLRDLVTLAYVSRGYVTSGAVLPAQSLAEGVLALEIVEGRLAAIEIETDGRFRPGPLRRRLEPAAAAPVNVGALEERLQLLQQDPRIRRLEARLAPGEEPGEALLQVRVFEQPPWLAALEANNYQPIAVGAERGEIQLGFENAAGFGDSARARYRMTQGLKDAEGRYEIPVTRWDTAIAVHARGSWSRLVAPDELDFLDVRSNAQTYGVSLDQPLFRSLRTRLSAFWIGEYLRSKSFLLGRGVSFEGVSESGVSKIAALRQGLDFTFRGRAQALAVRTTMSLGLPVLGATQRSGFAADGEFVDWLTQAQWAIRLPWLEAELLLRADLQLSDSPLLGLEKFAIGGWSTVRGYQENQLVRDNGFVGSIETRLPILRAGPARLRLELAPFLDLGQSWDHRDTRGPKTIASGGLGLRAAWAERAQAQIYWGQSIRDIDGPDGNLQEYGVHLGITVSAP
jgi:hemolysin activation/secretion protein